MKLSSIECIARALNNAEVSFLVVGGLAVVAHGYGRQTQDLDLVIRLDAPCINAAFAALAGLGYHPRIPVTSQQMADPSQRSRWISERAMVVLPFHSELHAETPIDIFVTEPIDFNTEYGAAMVTDVAPGVPLRIVRLETLLRMKADAGRPQDLADIAELRQIHGGKK